MRKLVSILLALIMVLSSVSALASTANTVTAYVTQNHLAVYSQRSTASKKLGTIRYGTQVEVEKINGTWARVKVGSKMGYVQKKYLSTEDPTASNDSSSSTSYPSSASKKGNIYKTSGDVYLRNGPSTSAKTKKVLYKGSYVAVIATSQGWAKVSTVYGNGYVSMKYLDSMKFVGTILSSYTTSYSSSQANRSSNIALAAKRLNGVTISSNGTLSILANVGPVTEKSGYLEAPTFSNGKLGSDIGGGICQIATTVYQAALMANLEITERHQHSLQVKYVGPDMDATVSWGGGKDLKIKNTSGASITVYVSAYNGKLTVTFIHK